MIGPDWLSREEVYWLLADQSTRLDVPNEIQQAIQQERSVFFVTVAMACEARHDYVIDIRNVGDLECLLRITEWIQRFCCNCLKKSFSHRRNLVGEPESIVSTEQNWPSIRVNNFEVPLLSSNEIDSAEIM